MFKLHKPLFFVFLFLVSGLSLANQSARIFPQIQVQVRQHIYSLEYANTFELRAQGLMFREEICNSCGMLFNFKQAKLAGMWMKNTLIPLDVAFIRADGKITNIKAMQPHDLTSIGSSEAVLYAWEMNQGWFAKNAIKVGDTVQIPIK